MKRKYFLAIIVTAGLLQACKKNEPVPSKPSFDTYVQSQPTLSMFAQAVDKAQLGDFKNGQGPFTWFAPTNNAFLAAGITQDSLNRMTPSQISYVLLYHLINPTSIPLTSITTKDMVAQNSFARGTQMGQNIYIGNYKDSFYINGNSLVSTDNFINNGVVHISNAFLTPPNLRGSLQTVLNNTGQHTLFVAALTKANRWTPLGSTSVFTVLAPTDAAMTAAGFTSAAITAAPASRIDSLVRYHLFSGSRLFSNDLGDRTSPPTILGTTKTIISSDRGRTFKGQGNMSTVSVVASNILATNGVLHVINGVLRP